MNGMRVTPSPGASAPGRGLVWFALLLLVITVARGHAQGLPRAKPEEVGLSSAALQRIAPALQAYIDSGKLAGIAAAVARNGKVVYYEAVGTLDAERAVPMRPDAVFRIYSMTKPVTSTAIMQLYERGKLRLEDPVSKYIPEFAGVQVYAGGPAASPTLRAPDRTLTIEHLLTHTSGISYGVFGNSAVDTMYRRASLLGPGQTLEQFGSAIARMPLMFSPGTAWNYGMSIDVLGRIVEVVSGKSFDVYLEEEIFRPLGMRTTAFHATSAMEGNLTALFLSAGERVRASAPLVGPGYRPTDRIFAGGQGLLSTIPDYMRFAQMLLNGGELDGKRVLKRETVALMMQNHLPQQLGSISFMRGYGFGYGGAVQIDSAAALVSPRGTFRWAGYASTFFWIDPKTNLIAMVWTQLIPTMSALDGEFQRLVYDAVVRPVSTPASVPR